MNTAQVRFFRSILVILAAVACAATSHAQVAVYTQPPNAAGGQYKSAWYAPDGLDSDERVWDAFTLAANTAITEVRWRGAYTNYLSGAGLAPVYDFTVAIYPSIAAGIQPDIIAGPIVQYHTNGNAGETPAGSAGGVNMYDYHFTLPAAFQAAAGTKYWVQIVAYQGLTPNYYWPPDWSIARGTGGEGSHFRRVGGTGGMFHSITGDCAFTLYASGAPTFTISAVASPTGAGTIVGAGVYPVGSNATLTANPNPGFGFVRWTEGGGQVSTNRNYTFGVTRDRSLVAEFTPAYSMTTSSLPSYGGTTTGGGVFNQGATVTVTATPRQGFVFSEWWDYGTPVSSSPTYQFPADSDHQLAAVFVHDANSTSFDFDDAPVHTSLPIALASGGLTAWFSATGGGYSIQPVGTVGISPPGFSGLCVYPNSVFPADLVADFSQPLTYFSILYSTQELACDDSARMRVTAFRNGVQVGTATTTAPTPGTWPSAFLSINVPAGFDRAVVHYDAPPPTCHDYGVIFMADNMTVSMACAPAGITDPPVPTQVCAGEAGMLFVNATGSGTLSYAWQLADPGVPGGWKPLEDGTLTIGGADVAWLTGTTTPVLDILTWTNFGSAEFRCVVTNGCGEAASPGATFSTIDCPVPCDPDFDQNGVADQDDVSYLINVIAGGDNPTARDPDFDQNGVADQDDVAALVNVVAGGACP